MFYRRFMGENVQTGGVMTFRYNTFAPPKLTNDQKADIEKGFADAEERRRQEKKKKIMIWIVVALVIILGAGLVWVISS